ncbi:hypothetical protein PHYBLDRAFT_64192 [Phycomyces blakesleeanus NRRL 1555(-)]|uniref:Uncharacterized protein n=1 Tax=Phycomyces blakesleeanus (strain ATCC 8743b / DSM 1359 / FGSC 10004 / NBRC 33097 / NRRL 1555) TaxID=763407 RepID=A0A167LM62_PHYB8|nr:hypothetical protein PHYBLDRAFT_64192 [Phycomyces blakesleeanus NRRL 1555(-)]OAD70727.1 hypothetical protein PHYBLDRAFT_64192 [Phycomyces blakesleeanus NRRL 1555(-)]|eukprot:XP_018288767.1 hypothetical protein PHYBLDRAFT_64192 [Phycomyces blakesleeanus NRRL 1555(-)]
MGKYIYGLNDTVLTVQVLLEDVLNGYGLDIELHIDLFDKPFCLGSYMISDIKVSQIQYGGLHDVLPSAFLLYQASKIVVHFVFCGICKGRFMCFDLSVASFKKIDKEEPRYFQGSRTWCFVWCEITAVCNLHLGSADTKYMKPLFTRFILTALQS